MKKIVLILLALMSFLYIQAQTVSYTFQPGAAVGIDANITTSTPTTNLGSGIQFSAIRTSSNVLTRGFLKFDLTTIPPNAIITNAKLTLSGLSHSGTNPSYLQKVTSAWSESTVTWSLAPTTTTVGQLSLAQSTISSQTYTLDVKNVVQGMVTLPATNYGWCMVKQNETVTGQLLFYSSDFSIENKRPKLEITYSLPMEVKASMVPATGSVSANGALKLSVTGGVPPYTYTWSDASTNKNLVNKVPGVYQVTVTDNTGMQVKKDLIIAAENSTMTFTITPDGASGKDALIQSHTNGTMKDNNNKDHLLFQAERGSASGWFSSRSLIEFDLFCLPSNATVNSASLSLSGNGHYYPRSNASYLYLNTSPWTESSLTWNNQPTHTTTNSVSLAATTSTNQNFSPSVTTQVQNWIQNPGSNFGWKLLLADETTNNYAYMVFGSSDNATASLRPKLIITITLPANTELQRNWKLEETYDQNGNVISSNKTYLDDLGRTTQSLSRDGNGDVFATQTVYDAYGRPAINSLPAYAGNTLTYKTNFMLNGSGQEYNYTNFDVSGKITTPDDIQISSVNTLGYYYSNANAVDTWQATATNPYSRTYYMADPYSDVKTTSGADNAFKAGTGREVKNYSMVCGDELKFILGSGNSYKVKVDVADPLTSTASTIASTGFIRATKSIVTSPDNKELVNYSVGDKVIATCMSGLPSPDNCSMTSIKNYMDWYGTQSIDIHIPDANKSSVTLPLPTYKVLSFTYTVSTADISYVITDMNTETVLVLNTDYTINATTRALTFSSGYLTANSGKPLFLRLRVVYTPSFITLESLGTLIPAGIVQYNLDYGRWSVNYYDFAGNTRKTVSAKGINCSSPGTITMATTYDYSHLGQLVAQKSPDEGLVEYAYNTDGQIRFTQNAEQKLGKRFSYVNYDLHGRSVESGEFSNVSGSGTNGLYFQNYYNAYTAPYTNNISTATIIDNKDGLFDTYCNDANYVSYEELSSGDDVPSGYTFSAGYLGKNKNGQVSKTWNANTTTWYKYDVAGRLAATVKKVNDADYVSFAGSSDDARIKTFENTYDPYFGTITNSYYQKNVNTEYVQHQFNFDANKRLSGVNFQAGASNMFAPLTKYTYDKLGRLIRQVTGPDLQGTDYVYTLNGALKAINHPSLDYTKDRGQDAGSYNDVTPGVKQDLFGEIIEYYSGDYTRTGTSIEANTNSNCKYNGLIYGTRFKTRNDVNGTITGADYVDYLGANQVQLVTTTNYGQQELANRYTYDHFGQLATSTFGTYTNTTGSFTARNDYKEFGTTNSSIAYDANGNITGLKRNSYNVSGSARLLDDLTFTYASNTNKHTQVADAASTNGFPSTFNYKNQTPGSPGTFAYNAIGQQTVSPDENVSAISYYPNGQVKQVTFSNGNITSHYYDDLGKKYKSTYYNASTTVTRYTWFLFNAVYEYISTVASFNLKEISIGGSGRVGVYKQDATGLNIATGHAEYEVTDHLGNVRATYKKGSGNVLEVLSKADYYAFGGQLPGRIWQQSGGEYRFGYQGQEKTQDESTWDNFELRNLNHDLGRWSAPDPYGQFASPYIAMGNNPVSYVDPDGGYINMSDEGQAQRAAFMAQQAEDRFLQRGRYSFEFLKASYDKAYDELRNKWFTAAGLFLHDRSGDNQMNFLEDLLKLNNEFAGLGLASFDYFKTGMDHVTLTTITNNRELVGSILKQSGSWERSSAKKEEGNVKSRKEHNFDNLADAYTLNVWQSNAREQLENWRSSVEEKNSSKEARILVRNGNHNAVGGSKNSVLEGLVQGHGGRDPRSSVTFVMNVIGKAGPGSLISTNLVMGASSVNIDITRISVYGPDQGDGATYIINFFDSQGNQYPQSYSGTIMPGAGEVNTIVTTNYADGDGPSFDGSGGTIIITVYLSKLRNYWNEYDQCWNVNFGYTLTTEK